MKLTTEEQEQIAEALTLGESQRSSGCASVNCSADWQRVTDTLPPMDTPCWLWDGKRIWIGGRGMVDGECWLWGNAYSSIWHNGVKWDADNETDDDYKPTHWLALPNPPNDQAQAHGLSKGDSKND